MSTHSDPWMRWFPSDWRSDPALRMCGMAARGLWVEILGVMHEANPRGHLLVKGAQPTAAQLAIIAGCSEGECADLLAELERNGVFSRKRNGTIYSRRMEADEIKARKNRDNGRKGGNPALRATAGKTTINPAPVKPEDKRRVKAHIQKPEARREINLSLSETAPAAHGACPSDDRFAEFWAAYPKHQGRDPAHVAFTRACIGTDPDAIIAGAVAYAAARASQDERFTMQAARWLTERRWKDAPAKPPEPPPKSTTPADRFRKLAAGFP